LESHPSVAEAEAIKRAILFAKETCCKLHIHHMSSKDGVELVKESKAEGIDVSTETGPHYLFLNSEKYKKLGSILKINPPVRSAENGEALWEGLKDGTVEVIATDHSPHTAYFTIVDMQKESVIDKNKLHSKTKITPFDGYKVKGVPVFTIVRGNVVMKDGKIIGEPQGRKIDPIG